jgi:hypothetical protein
MQAQRLPVGLRERQQERRPRKQPQDRWQQQQLPDVSSAERLPEAPLDREPPR